jgi:effector-binding domain-containing protein
MTSSELPRLEDVPAQKVAYIAARGSYEMLPAQMIELAMWFGRQAIDLGGQPGATYVNGPDQADEDDLEWEVWIPTSATVRERESAGGQIGVKTLAAATCATLVHVGPYETLDSSSAALVQWAADEGHVREGPLQTIFLDDPGDVPEDELKTLIRFPIKS